MLRGRMMTAVAAVLGLGTSALAQTTFTETEPNDSVTGANTATFTIVGDRITGTATTTNSDFWRITTAVQPAGIYRCVVNHAASTFPTFLMGTTQSGGVANPFVDPGIALQSGSASASARPVVWYSFGKGETVYYKITGPSAAGGTYTGTFARSQITPVDAAGTLYEGPVTLRVINLGANVIDSDTWLIENRLEGNFPGGLADLQYRFSLRAGRIAELVIAP